MKNFFFNTTFNSNFIFWVLFAAISPGIIAFTLYTKVQKYVGASLAGFTLYIFSIYSAIYGIILFNEAALSFHYYGAALVFIGVYLARKLLNEIFISYYFLIYCIAYLAVLIFIYFFQRNLLYHPSENNYQNR